MNHASPKFRRSLRSHKKGTSVRDLRPRSSRVCHVHRRPGYGTRRYSCVAEIDTAAPRMDARFNGDLPYMSTRHGRHEVARTSCTHGSRPRHERVSSGRQTVYCFYRREIRTRLARASQGCLPGRRNMHAGSATTEGFACSARSASATWGSPSDIGRATSERPASASATRTPPEEVDLATLRKINYRQQIKALQRMLTFGWAAPAASTGSQGFFPC